MVVLSLLWEQVERGYLLRHEVELPDTAPTSPRTMEDQTTEPLQLVVVVSAS